MSDGLSRLVCRPALPKDTADVLALTGKIWEGHDYIAYVWQDWLADPAGLLASAEYGGRVVGLCKLSDQGEGEWWLQGLRVDPAFQGQGVASHLHEYILAHWEKLGGVLRLGTSSARVQVQHLCERTGFAKVMEYISYSAPALPGGKPAFTPLQPAHAREAVDLTARFDFPGQAGAFIDLFWEWARFTPMRLAHTAQSGQAYWWRQRERAGMAVIGVDSEDDQPAPFIQYLACQPDALPELLLDCRRLAFVAGYKRIVWAAPHAGEALKGLEAAGFTREWENALFLYEKRQESALSGL